MFSTLFLLKAILMLILLTWMNITLSVSSNMSMNESIREHFLRGVVYPISDCCILIFLISIGYKNLGFIGKLGSYLILLIKESMGLAALVQKQETSDSEERIREALAALVQKQETPDSEERIREALAALVQKQETSDSEDKNILTLERELAEMDCVE